MSGRIRIKDIAARAGVSVGTVDRVLHGRGNVSDAALKKVEAVLRETGYERNVFASALAENRSYVFFLLLPEHGSEAYWDEIEEGALSACMARRDFSIDVRIVHYRRLDATDFARVGAACLSEKPDGVIIVPAGREATRSLTERLHEMRIPFVFLDSYLPELKPLSFYGQDSVSSGFFAARMLMLLTAGEKELMLMKMTRDGQVSSVQQDNREAGFLRYMGIHHQDVTIRELCLPLDGGKEAYDELLEGFFEEHGSVHHGITFGSRAYVVGEFLLRTGKNDVQIMGYDMVERNADCLRKGSISFLIAQHAYMQGYGCVEALFRHVVLRRAVSPVNYMPIEILSKENVDFYQKIIH